MNVERAHASLDDTTIGHLYASSQKKTCMVAPNKIFWPKSNAIKELKYFPELRNRTISIQLKRKMCIHTMIWKSKKISVSMQPMHSKK